jgi:hypothetical protein
MVLYAAGLALPSIRDIVVHKSGGMDDTTLAPDFDSMTIANSVDLLVHTKATPAWRIPLSQIDSVTFPYNGGPPCQVISPNGGETYHVGDSLILRWKINPPAVEASGRQKIVVLLSLDSGQDYPIQLDLGGQEPQVLNSDPRYNSNHEMSIKWKITNPMTQAVPSHSTMPGSPVSATCKIKVGVYDHYFEPENFDESDGVFSIQ